MNKFQLSALLVVMSAVLVTGCATSSGSAGIADATKVASIKSGKTTMREVEALLGRPMHIGMAEGGEQVWQYNRTDVSAKNFIPFANLMGGNVKTNTLQIRFTKKGVVNGTSGLVENTY